MIEVIGVTKKYGEIYAVKDISFSVETNRVYGFLGPNGAGKTTTMNIITGCLAATAGTVKINGYDIYQEPYEAKRHMGYLPEIPPLYLEMTTREYLKFVAEAKGIRKSEVNEQIDIVTERTGIVDVSNRIIRNLSKGYRQRVGLSQAIIGTPQILILDEPTVGLDPRQIIEMRELIKDLGKDHTVILSSHILSEVGAVCDHILIINKGSLVASDTSENLQSQFKKHNRLNLTVSGNLKKMKSVLRNIEGISKVTFNTVASSDMVDIVLESSSEVDARDKVSKALINSDCLILSMTQSMMSLEDIFLHLTASEQDISKNDTKEKVEDGGNQE